MIRRGWFTHWPRLLAGLCALLAAPAAQADPAALCDQAAARAAAQTGVPVAVLRAVALTETGRRMGAAMRPWPWTVNHAGDGRWFATPAEALAFAGSVLESGSRNVDLGCFQINHRWHAGAFPSLDAMIDPEANAQYAARFLLDLHRESGDWSVAAGAFHSRTAVFATRYRDRFEAHLATLGPQEAPAPGPRANAYPLLRAGAGGGIGSLVPRVQVQPALIGGAVAPLFGKG